MSIMQVGKQASTTESATETIQKSKENGNMRGIPTSACPLCGDKWLLIPVVFDDESYDIAGYGTDAMCYSCGVAVTAPTPLDHPDYEENWI